MEETNEEVAMRSWAWGVWPLMMSGLVGCSSEWVEKRVPGEPNGGGVASTRAHTTNGTSQARNDTNGADGEASHDETAREVPLGKHTVTLEFPAARARHIKEGDEIDLFVTFDPRTHIAKEGFEPPKYAGMVASYQSEVMANTCDERVCAVTMLMDRDHKLGVLAMHASPDHGLHPWVHIEGSEAIEWLSQKTLKDVLMDLEVTQAAQDAHVRKPAKRARRIVLEVENSPLAVGLIRDGVEGELAGAFAIEGEAELADRGDDRMDTSRVAISLLQRVRVERARVEGERVVIELVVPVDVARMLAISRYGAVRIDFSIQSPAEDDLEIQEIFAREFIIESGVWTHTPRPHRRPRRRVRPNETPVVMKKEP